MKWKVVIFLSAILVCFSLSFVVPIYADPAYYEMTVTVTAGTTRFPAGTPVVVKISDITAELGGADIDWDSIYMFYDSEIVPYQIDDIDGIAGISADDELVFQVAEEIAAGNSADYTLWFAEVADDFQSFTWPNLAWIDYAEDYSQTDLGALGGPDAPPGPVYFVKNDMVTISVPLQVEWRQGSAFNALIDATGWDVVKQGDYYSRSWAWRWSGFLYESDFGWVNTPTNFTLVKAVLEGPVRSMLVINSTAAYKGPDGIIPQAHELKTFTIYKDMPAVYSDIALTGANASYDYNFTYHAKLLDFPVSGGTYDWVYAPGAGFKPRWNYTLGHGVAGTVHDVDLGYTPLTSWWFKMYNDTSGRGYGLCFSPEDLLKIDWSQNDELDLTYEDLDEPPYVAKRLLVLFDPSVTTNSTSLMERMYDTWSAEPTVALGTAAVTTEEPNLEMIALEAGLEESRLQQVILQTRISILGLTNDMLNSLVSTLQETIDDQAILIDDMNNTITALNETISDLEDTITTLESTIGDQADLIDDLDDTLSALDSTVSDLQSELDEAKDSASSATTYGMAGIAVGIIGIIIGAVALLRKR